ncbi:hydroxyacylglutathione hydrolase [Paracoccus sp. 1_MG-2023]|uniref:hydroxyacylglutathione hydrolase n=1 Tax=unclassified Paracoccus (in: a-proteobacteria) TaxID=2688777 RepID=UPI001C0A43DC|nr:MULTISPECIES: hydroxyacylglutathione hydrolase [unclassified Paracoccus (in: a-proteobacteria)]MBU2958377.1 hydroxyacylglutathione hydrolase [Paracoccus sp. C2R09]MDO6668638.1 hydroxyacylglutathione hydrolase [Paracoccus sp. 1_MG-2023]
MPLELVTIRCLKDNYAYLLHGPAGTALIDAPEAAPILTELDARGWGLDMILLTHHHDDHIQGVPALVEATGAEVLGAEADARRLPPLDQQVAPGQALTVLGEPVEVIDVPGHTIGHVAFHFPESGMAFTADSLMAMGCGRLFEGTPEQMWRALRQLNGLPGDTLICSGHDYCATNGAFALSVDPDNADLRERLEALQESRMPCAPATLAMERATNPFLRAGHLAASLGMADAPEVEVFAQLRRMKDEF